MNGLLLSLQFFTSIPVRKELPMERKDVTRMYIALPIIGGLIGISMYLIAYLFTNVIGTGPLLAAVFVVLTGVALTGGLHLDGFADTGDAFFSYRDPIKRLEILVDPRIGAFGTMSLVLLILVKIALFHEFLLGHTEWLPLFLAVPILSRVGMNIYFTTTRPAKEKGIAHFFMGKLSKGKLIGWSILIGATALTGLGLALHSVIAPVALVLVLGAGLFLFRRWSLKNFGGVSGDLCGAFIEGMEALLWLTIIICI
ncbi:adenosylcobinamide-GDP ribazoletransferase [Sporosarcina thermotolerans]|uniref:Adenosylcobinamide-GDP ribazoletransferase n=1 Tax=Sporosarcina thermotolerans TaxID=633404 RepID=A0AAW9A5S1_9BACL|nr:adenosylcobinamide-GDP ribazoletransferase [Sporosarcina thermotolerans]MDW0116422.1 adenosylcobinamide-GDP ribazoletransferase [Sporosarcina thermotolerans]WHT48372.1 adenosylcobinamide-GDP ribazoletransferase [Sporosarcina thermotolerans]